MTPPSPNSPQWHRQKIELAKARRVLLVQEGCATEEEADVLTAHDIRHHQKALDALTQTKENRRG